MRQPFTPTAYVTPDTPLIDFPQPPPLSRAPYTPPPYDQPLQTDMYNTFPAPPSPLPFLIALSLNVICTSPLSFSGGLRVCCHHHGRRLLHPAAVADVAHPPHKRGAPPEREAVRGRQHTLPAGVMQGQQRGQGVMDQGGSMEQNISVEALLDEVLCSPMIEMP